MNYKTSQRIRERNNNYRRNNPAKVKAWDRRKQLRTLYGITPADVERMWHAQNKMCGICKRGIELMGRYTHVDHNHATGRVRGLLCHQCNVRLNPLEDARFLLAALLYLLRH